MIYYYKRNEVCMGCFDREGDVGMAKKERRRVKEGALLS